MDNTNNTWRAAKIMEIFALSEKIPPGEKEAVFISALMALMICPASNKFEAFEWVKEIFTRHSESRK
jgi:hypothetical protein